MEVFKQRLVGSVYYCADLDTFLITYKDNYTNEYFVELDAYIVDRDMHPFEYYLCQDEKYEYICNI